MGRKNTRNLNMPPHMHPRTQRSGKVYYYMHTSDKPRKEIALGSDFILALRKYADLNVSDAPKEAAHFSDVITKYQVEALPRLAPNTIKMYRSDIIKHIGAFFADAKLSQIRPMHIKQFLDDHIGVLRRNPRKFCHSKSSAARSAFRSIILPLPIARGVPCARVT